MLTRVASLCGAVAIAASLVIAAPARAQDVIKIGDVNSYTNFPDHLGHYKNGMEMALDEVNSAGGINGKRLVVVTRDD